MHRLVRALSLGTAALAGTGCWARAQSGSATVQPQPILVELFTSEGCSSCPPADALLAKISGKQMPSGRPIVTISEHVTYWNHEGWMDPFSSDAATERQKDYASELHLENGPYTPQIVVDGIIQAVGSNERAVDDALLSADRETTGLALKIDSAAVSGGDVEVHFDLTGDSSKRRRIEVLAIITDDQDTVHVRAGENADRTLTHVTVARSMNHVEVRGAQTEGTIRVKLPEKPPEGGDAGRHLIVVAQEPGPGAVLAVAERAM